MQHAPALLLLLLLLLLQVANFHGASAEFTDGVTTSCARTSARFYPLGAGRDWDAEFRRLVAPFATRRLPCPHGRVCAQKLTSEEGQEATYSEDCWDRNSVTEYTEIACYSDLCNRNLTFASFPGLRRSYFRSGVTLQCYNHGQLPRLQLFNELIDINYYRYRYGQSLPVSQWRGGMCGAAIYSSGGRAASVHERVLTGDRRQKFALLRVCPVGGCDRGVLREVMRLGYAY